MESRVQARQAFAATGVRTIGVTPARARVVFINEGRAPVRVPGGTVVATAGGQRFRTAQEVTVPGLTAQYVADVPVAYAAGRAEVEAVAVVAGAASRRRRRLGSGLRRAAKISR